MIFNTTSKSEYVIFVKMRGLKDKPLITLTPNEEDNDEKLNAPDPEQYFNYVYLPISILLEDQIVSNLKLSLLGLYKLDNDKINKVLKALRPTRIGDKTAGVKGGFIKYWKADFGVKKKDVEKITGDYKQNYTVSFVTPPNIDLESIEQHLYENGVIKLDLTNLSYYYIRSSAKLIGGRKYKNLS